MRLLAALLLSAALTGQIARAEPMRVVADIAPVHGLVAMVMGDTGEPALLMPPEASPHAAQLRPSDARRLQEADLVFWIGPALSPWLERGLRSLAPDAGQVVLMDVPGTLVLDQEPHDEDGDAEHDHHGPVDPHAWLAPDNAAAWLPAIAAALAERDPSNGAAYRANAAAAQRRIDEMRQRLDTMLAPVRDIPFLAHHDGTRYFEAAFGLRSEAAIITADGANPGAARLSALRDAVSAHSIRCVLIEPQFSDRLPRSLDDGTIHFQTVDLMGIGLAQGPDLYPDLLLQLGAAFRTCLSATQ